jgi:hypothetical protein
MQLPLNARAASLWAFFAWLIFAGGGHAHIDAVRLSLAQLFLQADVVVLARIDAVSDRDFGEDGKQELLEVVTATVIEQSKGQAESQLDIFLDAHGPAHYRPGDMAVLFLERPGSQHRLARYVQQGKLDFLSQQVRNTEHIVHASDLPDYRWVLGKYSAALRETTGGSESAESILLRMLDSASPALVESALIDWQNTGAGLRFDEREVQQIIAITRDDARPINLRLAILRTLASQDLVGPEAWDALFAQSSEQQLVPVVRSTRGYEDRHFAPTLQGLLDSSSEPLAEAAARALGHPVYTGSEAALGKLLERGSQRLNYAAVAALAEINSGQSLTILQAAARYHPDEKVRRLIDARVGVAD